uniref:outer dynein arm-docking complex subunit 1-like n=1 Tax=Centroberyx gerrardi TaxID=166262 RepID=UPI003AACC332
MKGQDSSMKGTILSLFAQDTPSEAWAASLPVVPGLSEGRGREIHKLQDEREEILRSLRVSESPFRRWTDASITHDLSTMLVSRDRIDEELEAEKHEVAFLKDQILKWERKLAGQRTGGGTKCLRRKSEKSNLQKTTCFLENKLHRGRVRFSKLLAKNGQLREELKILRVERKQFLHVRSRMEKELHEIRKDIRNVMTKCIAAFEASDDIQGKQRMLKDKTAEDVALYITKKSNLEQVISHDRNFRAFLDIKATARITQGISSRKAEQRKNLESREWGLEAFEEAVNTIHKETGERDLDKLARTFIEMEEQNYALLNFVNYQHNEAETIREQIIQLCDGMVSFGGEERRQQEEHQALLTGVSIKQEAAEGQLAACRQSIASVDKILDQLKKGVETLFHNINCDSLVIYDQLGSSSGIQDHNITVYLGLVEDRINELLTLQSYLRSQENISQTDLNRDNLSTIAGQLLGINPPLPSLSTAVEAPSAGDDTDHVESLLQEQNEPISRGSLLPLVSKRILRREKTACPEAHSRRRSSEVL